MKRKIAAIIKALEKEYGRPQVRKQAEPLGSLVVTILSQNTTDKNSGRAYDSLRRAFPRWDLPEIAFAGRSNVGKSSVIDTLLSGHCRIRISRTPGRTREINFFRVSLAGGREFSVVDLPGYGYAKVPHAMREHWGRLVSAYIESELD